MSFQAVECTSFNSNTKRILLFFNKKLDARHFCPNIKHVGNKLSYIVSRYRAERSRGDANMSIDRLKLAAAAAGYAMATVEDEPTPIDKKDVAIAEKRSAQLALPAPAKHGFVDTLIEKGEWVRTLLPSFGGRAPA